MAFLKTFFWVIVAVIVALLWQSSPRVNLPIGAEDADGIIINSRLGTWIILSFLAGFAPLYLYHRTTKWRLKRRVKTLEAEVANHSRMAATEAEARAAEARADAAEEASAQDRIAAAKAETLPSPRPTGEGENA